MKSGFMSVTLSPAVVDLSLLMSLGRNRNCSGYVSGPVLDELASREKSSKGRN